MLNNISKILVFCSIFLISFKIIDIPITQILILLLGFTLLFYKKRLSYLGFFSKHKIKSLLVLILVFSIITYIFKSVNIDEVKRIYHYNTGFSPNYLYLKMITNGIYAILFSLFTFSLGLTFNGNLYSISKIIRFLINLITINAIINICFWAFQTGGVIDRYNFKPAIIDSFGTNIQLSILGFLLQLSQINKNKLLSIKFLKLITLFFSILIIVSRQNQLVFVLCLIFYFYLKTKKNVNYKLFVFVLLIFLGIYLILPLLNLNILSSYEDLTNLNGDDFQVRFTIIFAALNILSDHLFMGIGYGMFAGYNSVSTFAERTESYLGSTHNGVVAVLVEFGIIGFIIHGILITQIVKSLIKTNQFKFNLKISVFTIPIFVFLILNIIMSITSNYILFPPPSEYSYTGLSIICWFLLGIVFSFNRRDV